MRRWCGVSVFFVGLGLGCGGAAPASTTPSPMRVEISTANANLAPSAPLLRAPVAIAWTDVRSSASCFFFSGPGDLGRDEHLGGSASLTLTPPGVELVFDAGGHRFVGHTSGETLAVGRDAPHEYGGTWTTRETLILTASGGAWVGTYHYDEIDPATRTPSSCHIDATVIVTRRP